MPTTFSPNVETVPVSPREHWRRASWSEGTTSDVNTAQLEGRASESKDDSYAGLCSTDGQPYAYPAPVFVRNTFVAIVTGRDPSLEGFFEERQIRSCPNSWGPTFGDCKEDEDMAAQHSSRTTACGSPPPECCSTPELTDTEDDMMEISPRDAALIESKIRAAILPSSSCSSRKTLSDYRLDGQNVQSSIDGTLAPCAGPAAVGMLRSDASSRQPFLTTMPQNGMLEEVPGYAAAYPDCYPAHVQGYDGSQFGAEVIFSIPVSDAAAYASPFATSSCDPSFNIPLDGHQASFPSCDGFNAFVSSATGPHIDAVPKQQGGQPHMVLKLSSALNPATPPFSPPGSPAPAAEEAPPPPPPLTMAPGGERDSVMLTRGSMDHGFGRCKPCAFVYTKGCGNGFQCPFCHLCEPGEKKKRRQEKLEVRRAFRDLRYRFSNRW